MANTPFLRRKHSAIESYEKYGKIQEYLDTRKKPKEEPSMAPAVESQRSNIQLKQMSQQQQRPTTLKITEDTDQEVANLSSRGPISATKEVADLSTRGPTIAKGSPMMVGKPLPFLAELQAINCCLIYLKVSYFVGK